MLLNRFRPVSAREPTLKPSVHSKFIEDKLEQAIIALLEAQGFPHTPGSTLARAPDEVLLQDDMRTFLSSRYAQDGINALHTMIEGLFDNILKHRKPEGYGKGGTYSGATGCGNG